ncbi:MAG: hypothetical protein JW731_12035 [Bacteroidales bacterium]|nr:hypothetical protein [Bacteroidales bacterium]
MITIYKSLSSDKKIVFGSRFKDGRIRVSIQNDYREIEPLYLIPGLSSKYILRLSDYRTQIINYPNKDIVQINKWPKEIFKKLN